LDKSFTRAQRLS